MPLTNCEETKSIERFMLCFLDLWRLSGILSKPLGKASWCSVAFGWSSGGFITRPIGAAQQAVVALLVAFIRYRFVCSQGSRSQLSNVIETKRKRAFAKQSETKAVVDLQVVIPPYHFAAAHLGTHCSWWLLWICRWLSHLISFCSSAPEHVKCSWWLQVVNPPCR